MATLVRLFHRFVEQDFVLLLQFLEFRQEHVLHLLHLLGQLILHSLHLDELFLGAFLITRSYLLILILLLKVALGLHLFRFLMCELFLVLLPALELGEVFSVGLCCLICLLSLFCVTLERLLGCLLLLLLLFVFEIFEIVSNCFLSLISFLHFEMAFYYIFLFSTLI